MLEVYWGCLIGGVVFALVAILLGDVIGHGHGLDHGADFDSHPFFDMLKPAVIVGAIAAFGGAGILLTRYTPFATLNITLLAIAIALVVSILVYLLYIRPMKNAENSVGFSMKDLAGTIGEVMIPIPEKGYGEVMIRIGGGTNCQIAASFDGRPIATGTQVVIVEADRDTIYVSPMNEER